MSTAYTLSPAPPWHISCNLRWISPSEMAKEWHRSAKCIREWCQDGTLVSAHCRVYKDIKGRWWIGIPIDTPHASHPIA